MGLHAEIVALRDSLGITYKDASHRLYMTEWEKVKTDERTNKAFSILGERTRASLFNIQSRLKQLDGRISEVDDAEAEPSTPAARDA